MLLAGLGELRPAGAGLTDAGEALRLVGARGAGRAVLLILAGLGVDRAHVGHHAHGLLAGARVALEAARAVHGAVALPRRGGAAAAALADRGEAAADAVVGLLARDVRGADAPRGGGVRLARPHEGAEVEASAERRQDEQGAQSLGERGEGRQVCVLHVQVPPKKFVWSTLGLKAVEFWFFRLPEMVVWQMP